MKDWDEPIDKGPRIEEPVNRHRKRRGGKKPFAIERRFVGCPKTYAHTSIYSLFESLREWHTFRRYKTEAQRAQAFATIEHKKIIDTYAMYANWEYRLE